MTTNAEEKKHRDFIINNIVKVVIQDKLKTTNYKLPRGYYDNFMKSYSASCPWLTSKMIRGHVDRKFPKVLESSILQNPPPPAAAIDTSSARKKGGRPKGTNNQRKEHLIDCSIAAVNEITLLYQEECNKVRSTNPKKRVSKGYFKKIEREVREKRNLPADFEVKYETVKKRIQHNRPIVEKGCGNGTGSPLRNFEPLLLQVVICMSRMRMPLTQGEGISLTNSMINDTPYQTELINWKKTTPSMKQKKILAL